MTTRITMKDLEGLVKEMNTSTGQDIALGHAYGQPRAYANKIKSRELSPRLSKRELYDWLHAYWKGYDSAEVERKGETTTNETETIGEISTRLANENSILVLEFALRKACFPNGTDEPGTVKIDGQLLYETPGKQTELDRMKQALRELEELKDI